MFYKVICAEFFNLFHNHELALVMCNTKIVLAINGKDPMTYLVFCVKLFCPIVLLPEVQFMLGKFYCFSYVGIHIDLVCGLTCQGYYPFYANVIKVQLF